MSKLYKFLFLSSHPSSHPSRALDFYKNFSNIYFRFVVFDNGNHRLPTKDGKIKSVEERTVPYVAVRTYMAAKGNREIQIQPPVK